jgi:hypothetical protein
MHRRFRKAAIVGDSTSGLEVELVVVFEAVVSGVRVDDDSLE